jgi:ADP-ribose pyrophosphatase
VEETGLSARSIEALGAFYPCPGYSTEYIHIFLATGLQPSEGTGDEDEDIEVVVVPIPRALAMVESGEIRDGKSIIALLKYARRAGL